MWLKRLDWGSPRNFNLDHLFGQKNKFDADPVAHTQFSNERFWLMGYVIPVFQRGPAFDTEKPIIEPFEKNAFGVEDNRKVIQPIWDEGRMIRFIQTAVERGHLGTWTYHVTDNEDVRRPDGSEYFPRDLWLIDGQQRLWSLHCFFNDQFPVYGKFWSEVDTIERRKFLSSTPFPAYEMKNMTELSLREAYDKMNFGGVGHEEYMRAAPGFKV
jgi:hypothetical protein